MTSVPLRECQLAFRVGPTEGPLRVSDRSKCYRTLPKLPRKSLILRYLQTCQGSGVSSILIGRSIKSATYTDLSSFPFSIIFHLRLFPPVRNPGERHLNVLQRDLSRVQRGHPGVAML